jgi:thiamine pyrophosphate-dependent acetolactate synthase large subunit-like protein
LPDPNVVDRIVDILRRAERPIILAGRGAVVAQAGPALRDLAGRCGALLATTLLGKGLFDADEFGIGIAGGYATDLARRLFGEADLVIGCGASLGHYTTEAGRLYKDAHVIQIDTAPRGLWQGLRVAHVHLHSDAKLGVEAVLERLRVRGIALKGWRTAEMAQRIAAEPPDGKQFPAKPDVVDPRKALLELDAVVPKDWDIVCGGAHFTDFVAPHLRGRSADRYHFISGFGAIGSALSEAIGIATTRPAGKVLLLEGDGSLLMHIQELETISRHRIKLLICALNDGAYGAEVHKFRARGMNPRESMHGYVDLAAIANGFGLCGANVHELQQFDKLMSRYSGDRKSALWDIHIDGTIPSPFYRRRFFGESTSD